MLRQGPIPAFVHGILDYGLAIVLIAAPLVLDFDSGAATAVSIVAGVGVLLLAASRVRWLRSWRPSARRSATR